MLRHIALTKDRVLKSRPLSFFSPNPSFFFPPLSGNGFEFGETKDRGLAYDEKGLADGINDFFNY